MKRYPKYKETSISWLKEVPEHWEIRKLGNMLSDVSLKNSPEMQLLSVVREKGIIVRDVTDKDSNHNYIPDDLSNYKVVKKGQFVMNKMKAWQGSYGISEYDGIVSPAYYVFDVVKDIVPKYFHNAIRSKLYVAYFGQASDGIRVGQWDLSKDRMKNIPFLIPPKEEQEQIANYLDYKTKEIDEMVELEERKKERLKSLIKGLHEDCILNYKNKKLKEVNLFWKKRIPENWKVIKLAHILKKISKEANEEDEIVICSNHGYSFLRGERKIGLTSDDNNMYQDVKEGQIMIHGMDTWHGAICISKHNGKCTKVVHLCETKENKEYIVYYLRLLAFLGMYKPYSNGVRQNTSDFRSWNKLGEIEIILPPKEEQEAIANYLDEKTAKLDQYSEMIDKKIEKLKALKQSIISEVVTGQIDIRDM